MPDPATDTLREALEELTEAVTDKLGTMNYYFGPGARTLVSSESKAAFLRILAAHDAAREALAAAPAEPKWEWRVRAHLPMRASPLSSMPYETPREPERMAQEEREMGHEACIERRRKAGEWERVT